MSETTNFSLAITTYNRAERIFWSIIKYETYRNIDEIVISDDKSQDYEVLNRANWSGKVKIFQNKTNLGAYKNKLLTLSRTKNNWIILFDSDNFFEEAFVDTLQKEDLDEDVIYCPSFAKPNFNYTNLNNVIIDRNNWNDFLKEDCFLNTGNSCLSRKAANFLLENIKTDPIQEPFVECKYMNYLFVKNGFKLKIVPNLDYQHAISHDSFYLSHRQYHEAFNQNFNWKL